MQIRIGMGVGRVIEMVLDSPGVISGKTLPTVCQQVGVESQKLTARNERVEEEQASLLSQFRASSFPHVKASRLVHTIQIRFLFVKTRQKMKNATGGHHGSWELRNVHGAGKLGFLAKSDSHLEQMIGE